jgi:lysophospholipid acyltransferase (LPLAT)-like uncharacterized protein
MNNNEPVNKMPLDKISFAIWAIATLLGKTWRPVLKSSNPQLTSFSSLGERNIYVLWHSTLLPIAYSFKAANAVVLISSSNDGKRAAAVASRWNCEVIFGSSSKDGVSGSRKCLRALQQNKNLIITPDGPKGPALKVKTGVAHISDITQVPVTPILLQLPSCWRLNSWDRMIIPKPFAKLEILIGKTAYPLKDSSDNRIETLRQQIEDNLNAVSLA